MIVIGIDPGKSGGIARVGKLNGEFIAEVVKMPATERDVWEQFQLWTFAVYSTPPVPVFAYIEKVHSMPGQGVASTFKFGQGYGFLRACLIASQVPFTEVTPRKWQTYMQCLTKGDKNVSKARAQQLYPDIKMTHAKADAILIARYGYETSLKVF